MTVRSIRHSILTVQALRSLRALDIAKTKHTAAVACGLARCVPFRKLRHDERELYLAEAEGELAAPPQFPVPDEEAAHA